METSMAPSDAGPEALLMDDAMFDLADVLRIIRFRLGIIAGTAVTIIALTAITLFQMTPLYSATALVILEGRQNNVVDIEAVLSGISTDPSSVENQIQILTSRGLAGRVVDTLNLQNDPEFNPRLDETGPSLIQALNPLRWFGSAGESLLSEAQETERAHDEIVSRFLSGLSVQPVGRSTAMQIVIQSPSAQKATRMANAVAEAYVDDQLNAKFEATERATSWLSERITSLAEEVQNAEAAAARYRAENALIATSNNTSVAGQQLTELNAQLIIARSNLAEQEARYAQVAALQGSGRSADVNTVVDSLLIGQLREQETQLLRQEAEMSSRYGPRHPEMLNLQSEKQNLIIKINEEVARVVQTTENEVIVARARVRSLQSSLAALEGQASEQNQARVRLGELEAQAATKRVLYETFLIRFNETEGQDEIEVPDARIVSAATTPGAPSHPNKRLALGIAVPGGLVLGFLIAFFVERLDTGFRTASQVEKLLGLPVLATVPELSGTSKSKGSAASRVVDKPMSSLAESIRGLQMGLILSNVDKRPKVVLLTSAVPGEGKTTLAISLARVAAKAGQKVIVIDCDFRRPTLDKTLGVKNLSGGVIGVLAGEISLDKAVFKDPLSDAYFLPAEKRASNPSDLLNSLRMERLMESFRQNYDLVIVDSAPLLPVNDTRGILRFVDAVLLVVRWEKTPRDAATSAARVLADVNAPVVGVALTRADTKRFQHYSYGYQNYYSYNKYYSD